jgi:FkbM family methyltransferase
MKNIIVNTNSWLRQFLSAIQNTRRWSQKYFDRVGRRLVISGGPVGFLDQKLVFPENVGLTYSTPLFWDGPQAYEPVTSQMLTTLIGHSKVFLDIGSNVGIFSVYAGVKHPGITTFAFEPVPAIWEKNVKFHQANHLPVDKVLRLALSDTESIQEFVLPIYTTGVEEEQTGTLNAKSWQSNEPAVQKFQVECTTLDRFAATHLLAEGRCCLKIDVENHEATVLRGGKEFIRNRRPWIVCEILYGQEVDSATGKRSHDNSEIQSIIRELACTPFAITNDGLFRVNLADFERPRSFKDFLLAPTEAIPPEVSYLDLESLTRLLSA